MRKVGVVAGGKGDVAGPVTGWEDDWSANAEVVKQVEAIGS